MNRRNLALAGVALAAGATGVWWSQRRSAPVDVAQLPIEAAPAVPAASAPPIDVWTQRFITPAGSELVFAELRGKPLVVNFWATWCPPCVKEMPELDRFHKAYAPKGWQVIGVAVDSPTPVREFLQKTPVGFPIGLAGFGGSELARALGNTGGGLPFTVVFDSQGKVAHTRLGQTSYAELAGWAAGS
jgi:thiol-disulfide isomerase/thioredoxin